MNKYIFAVLFSIKVLYETELNAFLRIRALLEGVNSPTICQSLSENWGEKQVLQFNILTTLQP